MYFHRPVTVSCPKFPLQICSARTWNRSCTDPLQSVQNLLCIVENLGCLEYNGAWGWQTGPEDRPCNWRHFGHYQKNPSAILTFSVYMLHIAICVSIPGHLVNPQLTLFCKLQSPPCPGWGRGVMGHDIERCMIDKYPHCLWLSH